MEKRDALDLDFENRCVFHNKRGKGKVVVADYESHKLLIDFGKLQKWVSIDDVMEAPAGKDLYFAYGSNLHIPQMQRRCKDCEAIVQGILSGYNLLYRSSVATIEPSPNSQVLGAVYTISQADKKHLDTYEGYPHLYYREMVDVETPHGIMSCITYKMHDHYPPMEPSHHYLQTIKDGYDFWKLPVEKLNVV